MSEQQVLDTYRITPEGIYGFFKEHRFLSNFHLCPVQYQGSTYPSSENAYMAAKTSDPIEKKLFEAISPNQAKTRGQHVVLKHNWEHPVESPWPVIELFKDQVMYDVLMDKFTRNKALHTALLETESKYLEETNWWKDQYWGVYQGEGKNKLGRILMLVRSQLK